MFDRELVDDVRVAAHPLHGGTSDYDLLLDRIGDRRVVLIGEASHGTHQFYRERARLTQKLIIEKGFQAVCAEADWPDAWRVDRFVRHASEDEETIDALADFERFPAWMWRNADVLDFVGWLRDHNEHLPDELRAGFYGLDLYSLHSSMNAVVAYLDEVDPEGARRARQRYGCFDQFGEDPQRYALGTARALAPSCEDEVIRQLADLRQRRGQLALQGIDELDAFFAAEQNARVAQNAEQYYRAMMGGRVNTWNLRDTHMADTVDAVLDHLERRGGHPAKIVIWAHNSHIGDARASDMGQRRREVSLGQLVRERHREDAYLIGMTTYTGTVTAASDWGGRAERKRVRPGRNDSWNGHFHATGIPRFWIETGDPRVASRLRRTLLERAIGVIYMPQTERWSHYFDANLGERFDAVLHFDETRAVEPLEREAGWEAGELPDTWPSTL